MAYQLASDGVVPMLPGAGDWAEYVMRVNTGGLDGYAHGGVIPDTNMLYNGPLPIYATASPLSKLNGVFVGFSRGVPPRNNPMHWHVVYATRYHRRGHANTDYLHLWVHGMNWLGEPMPLPVKQKASRNKRLIAWADVFQPGMGYTKAETIENIDIVHAVYVQEGNPYQEQIDHTNWEREGYGLVALY